MYGVPGTPPMAYRGAPTEKFSGEAFHDADGAAIYLDQIRRDARDWNLQEAQVRAIVAVHEIGHLFGLSTNTDGQIGTIGHRDYRWVNGERMRNVNIMNSAITADFIFSRFDPNEISGLRKRRQCPKAEAPDSQLPLAFSEK